MTGIVEIVAGLSILANLVMGIVNIFKRRETRTLSDGLDRAGEALQVLEKAIEDAKGMKTEDAGRTVTKRNIPLDMRVVVDEGRKIAGIVAELSGKARIKALDRIIEKAP